MKMLLWKYIQNYFRMERHYIFAYVEGFNCHRRQLASNTEDVKTPWTPNAVMDTTPYSYAYILRRISVRVLIFWQH